MHNTTDIEQTTSACESPSTISPFVFFQQNDMYALFLRTERRVSARLMELLSLLSEKENIQKNFDIIKNRLHDLQENHLLETNRPNSAVSAPAIELPDTTSEFCWYPSSLFEQSNAIYKKLNKMVIFKKELEELLAEIEILDTKTLVSPPKADLTTQTPNKTPLLSYEKTSKNKRLLKQLEKKEAFLLQILGELTQLNKSLHKSFIEYYDYFTNKTQQILDLSPLQKKWENEPLIMAYKPKASHATLSKYYIFAEETLKLINDLDHIECLKEPTISTITTILSRSGTVRQDQAQKRAFISSFEEPPAKKQLKSSDILDEIDNFLADEVTEDNGYNPEGEPPAKKQPEIDDIFSVFDVFLDGVVIDGNGSNSEDEALNLGLIF